MVDNSNNTDLRQNNFFISSVYKKALLPCMLSILSANINVVIDGILIGQKLGNNALAAINICLPINLLLCVIGSFVSAGAAINSSKALGGNRITKANDYYKLGIIVSYLVSVVFTFIGIAFINDICVGLCSNVDILPYVRSYSLIILIGSIFKILIYIPFWYLRLDGQNKEISIMMIVLTVGNIILDIIFIFVLNMGVFGAGLANVISTAVAMLLGLYFLANNRSGFRFDLKINWKNISVKNFIMDGIPSSLNNLCATVRILIINAMLLSFGGASLVAAFTAVNGLFGIGECIILGIPQASNAMLGVYLGERDNLSCKLIVKYEIYIGAIYSVIFLGICSIISPFFNIIYGLESSLVLPVLLMALSIFPALLCNILSSFYNILGRNILSSLIIILRLVVFTYIGLYFATLFQINVFSFWIIAEILTLFVVCIVTSIYHIYNKNFDRFLLCYMNTDLSGKVINFSVDDEKAAICNASEKISAFCTTNGLSVKDTTKIQLAIEEALVLISELNNNEMSELGSFDIRVFIYEDLSGIRIRYSGLDFNPFEGNMESTDYLGIKMVHDLLESISYRRTFGVNTLILTLKENYNG